MNNLSVDIPSLSVTSVFRPSGCGMVLQKPNPFPKSIDETVAYGPLIGRGRGAKR